MQLPDFEPFFNEECQEPFFIKSLENVQGDERDTIIFSIGYARDSKGVMKMQFGPLGLSGGERRLNVAITRGKYNVKLVGSILPGDIDVNRISSEGPKLLKGYIDFAMNGPSAPEKEEEGEGEHSAFEKAVCRFLESHGYSVATQVGCSGYRIDIAVRHPGISGQYIMGIECDGASYHSARTARERDRLRRDMLETMGWNLYHIWSADWITDPEAKGKELIAAIEHALSEYGKNKGISNSPEEKPEKMFETEAIFTEEPLTEEALKNPYGFEKLAVTQYDELVKAMDIVGDSEDLYDLEDIYDLEDPDVWADMTGSVELVIKKEYPVHYDIICQRLCPVMGRDKVTSVVQKTVTAFLDKLERQEKVLCKEGFYFPAEYKEVPARQADGRPIRHISVEELASGMFRIVKTCVGCPREMLLNETIRAFGFTRKGANITAAMERAYELLEMENKICEADGKVLCSRGDNP